MERFKEFIEFIGIAMMIILIFAFVSLIFAGLVVFLFTLGGILGYILGPFIILFYIVLLIWVILKLIEELKN